MKNPYKLELHRLAFDQAVELYQSGMTDDLQISKQLDPAILRYMRQKIAAQVARLLNKPKPSRAGTPPNTSMVLSADELAFINQNYDGEKSRAIHDGLKLLMNKAP